jgi:hypothetical protein
VAAAVVAALVLGISASSTSTPTAQAEVTDTVVVGCELLAAGIDGDLTDATAGADLVAACDGIDATEAGLLAGEVGDGDGTLEPEDFRNDDLNEDWDANQLQETCDTVAELCALVAIVFVDDDGTTLIDPGSGVVVNEEPASALYTCDTAAEDADCNVAPLDGDGVVFGTLIAAAGAAAPSAGDTVGVNVEQEAVSDSFDVNIVGVPVDIEVTIAEPVIQTNGSTTAANACGADDDALSDPTAVIEDPTTTLAYAVVTDDGGTELTRIVNTAGGGSLEISVPTGDDPDIATIGDTTSISIDPETAGAPTAYYVVVCGGSGTGETTVTAEMLIGGTTESSTADLTVVGEPDAIALAPQNAIISCNGTNSQTITATITDADGNPVAQGVDVNFSVVALGTANPINTTTDDAGTASSAITPLSAATAGVTVVVTSGSVSASTRVDCAIPITPTVAAPVGTPTRTGTIGGPDTGNGGYLGQDSAGFPLWTLVALALGSFALVAGGMVTRRVGR